MTNLIIEISKYFMILCLLLYVRVLCGISSENQTGTKRTYFKQTVRSNLSDPLWCLCGDLSGDGWYQYADFYAAQAVLLAMIQTCYQLFTADHRDFWRTICACFDDRVYHADKAFFWQRQKTIFYSTGVDDIFAHHPGIDQPGWICAEIILVICNRWDPGAFGCDDRRKYKLWS